MKIKVLLARLMLLGFLLGIYNGRVAIWKEPDPEPWRVLPYCASALPSEVQQVLRQGIRIESEADLDSLLENFCS